MGNLIKITTSDGHTLGAYQAIPKGQPKGGIVILQEIFGVTEHIQRVADGYAARGYLAIAPSLFDRIQPGAILDYSDIDQGREIMQQLNQDLVVADIVASVDAVRTAGKVAAVGYCWGGAIADLAACRTNIDAAVAYYGRMIVDWLDEPPRCPVMYHFGAKDPLIPPELVEQIRGGRSAGIFFQYPEAGHGFNCDEREEFHPESADLALDRTLIFLEENL